MKECNVCGICLELNDFYLTKSGGRVRNTCKVCYKAQLIRERREVKMWIIELMGGKCAHCGIVDIPEIYDLHHLDPSKKEIGIARIVRKSSSDGTKRLLRELAKCILLCANCHRKVHATPIA